ncbi:NAD(P)H-dependent oxidoreductase [Paenibacillus sp. SYP-B3998]|uniref:NAD(P)H-dependent oxidoreductase n=1 Tax=Paenibacillus sp. SYP-B3998 TaxID=2678564 RepID=A0A6G3ZXB0_9BACL|nr:NAD(P)H-dependent oxidoreductase [Paenibacillus sp. SYP-B3998]NEW06772.1 NAD(P)H-dependent oxidoreductase [Paenibacillus sp. SYP-B3998]
MQKVKDQIFQAYQFRHACKEFDSTKKVSNADFDFILETGRLSPSSFGFEPWKFVVIQNPLLREKLLPVTWGAQKQLPTSSHFVIVLSRTQADLVADSAFIQSMMKDIQLLPEEVQQGKGKVFHNFLEKDFKLLDSERITFEWGCRQTYIALGNMMTAAAQIGIDSCPVEGFHKEKAEQILKEEGILKGNFGIACMVAFGYRINEPRPKTRQSIEQIVEWVQ